MPWNELLTPGVLIPWLLGMAFGVFVGATPGLTATMAVALLVPVSLNLPANAGLAMIIGVSFTAIFAGDIPVTYLRIPGTPASASATLDGHALAEQGRGHFALLLNLWCSAIGGLIGVSVLIFLAPQLAKAALKFSNFEYFWLAILGLSLSAVVSAGHTLKGLAAAALGLLISTVGIDVVSGAPRFTFESVNLTGGIQFIPVMIGLFGMAEVFRNLGTMGGPPAEAPTPARDGKGNLFDVWRAIWSRKFTVARGAATGTVVGALPGAGADVAAWASYGLAQRISREPESFGKGAIEGVIAPTSANNAAVAGAWIPALVFGIPGDAVTAIVLGALMMYNITPGPEIFTRHASEVQSIFAIGLLTQVLLLVAGYAGIRAYGGIMRLPRRIIMSGVVVFSVVGAYSLGNRFFDVWVMLGAGVLGFFLDRNRVPLSPLILGMILGPLAEKKLRAGLISARGNYSEMFTQPICAVLVAVLVGMFVGPVVIRQLRHSAKGND